jgi:NADH:ubiquinone oxidoreductase subunit E
MDTHDSKPSPTQGADDRTDAASRSGRSSWRPPAHRIRICLVDSCQDDGGRELQEAIEERLGIGIDERTEDGTIGLEGLDCVGLCGIRHSLLIDDEPVIGLAAVLRAVDDLQPKEPV